MKKALSMLLAIFIVTSVLVGCGQKKSEGNGINTSTGTKSVTDENGKVVLRIAWWGNPTRDERTQAVIDLYTKLNPNVTFETEPVGWSGYWDKLATQTAAGSLPDIIAQDFAFIGQYINKGVLADLTPYTINGILDLSDISDSILQGGKGENGLYGIPLGMNALGYCYNTRLMEDAHINNIDPDWTWDDFDKMVENVYTSTGVRSETPIWDDPKFMLEYLLKQNSMQLYSNDGKSLGFTYNNVIVKFFERLKRGIENGSYPKAEEFGNIKTMEQNMFVTGQTLGGFIWSNFFVAYSDLAKDELALTVIPNDNGKSGLYLKPSMFFAVPETSKQKEAAAKFINFFTNSVDANNILLAERGIPIAGKVREGIKGHVSDIVAKTFDYISLVEKYATPISKPEPGAAAQVTKLIKSYYEQVAYGMASSEEAAKGLIEEANAALSN